MFKTMLVASVVMIAGSASAAFAQSRLDEAYAAAPSYSSLRARCDRALTAIGRADASSAVRQRCVAILRARVAARKWPANCYTYRDPRHRGWSMTAHAFNVIQARGMRPCPGW
jgi:hypothetical protein